jgi:hypothetical protein
MGRLLLVFSLVLQTELKFETVIIMILNSRNRFRLGVRLTAPESLLLLFYYPSRMKTMRSLFISDGIDAPAEHARLDFLLRTYSAG